MYSKLVCPFVDGLPLGELLVNLSLVLIFQAGTRELLYWYVPRNQTLSWARQGYYLSIVSWVLAGVAAGALHLVRYPDMLFSSHIKLLSGYWVLGGGVLAQWEYIVLEKAARSQDKGGEKGSGREQISMKIVEGFFLFTLVPSLVMLLVISRYIFQGRIEPDVGLDVSYVGIFFVLISLTVAFRYGREIRNDIL